MRNKHLFTCLMIIVFLVSACAPEATPASPSQAAVEPSPTPTAIPVGDTATAAAVAPTEALAASPPAIATSRGPDLHATDPATVKLASGGLQLVEFFRFT